MEPGGLSGKMRREEESGGEAGEENKGEKIKGEGGGARENN